MVRGQDKERRDCTVIMKFGSIRVFSLARALLTKRAALNPNSSWSWSWRCTEEALEGLNDRAGAEVARWKVSTLRAA